MRRLLILTMPLTLLVAACGSDSDNDSSAGRETPASEETAPASSTDADGTTGSTDDTTGSTDGGTDDSGPVVIGVASSLTGPLSFYDGEILNGMRLAVDEHNASGGVDSRTLELVTADNKTDLSLVEQTAQEVIDQGAVVVVPTCDYDTGAPAARLADSSGLLVVGCAGGVGFGAKGVGPNTFNTFAGGPTEGATMAQFVKDQGWTKPYLLEDTSIEYSKAACRYFEESWTAMGEEIAGADTFQNGDPSIATQVTSLHDADADVVIACTYVPGGASAVKQIRDGGIDLPIVAGVGMEGTFWISESVPDLSDFYKVATGSVVGDDPRSAVNDFVAAYTEAYGTPPLTSFSLMGYQNIQTIAHALANAGGSTSGADLAAVLSGLTDADFILGPTTYTADCHVPLGRPMVVMTVQQGVETSVGLVEPTELPASDC